MSLVDKIEKIQKKPRKKRIFLMWILTGIVMAIIVVIWLFSFSHSLKEYKREGTLEKSQLPSLFESIKKDFSGLGKSLENLNASVENAIPENNEK